MFFHWICIHCLRLNYFTAYTLALPTIKSTILPAIMEPIISIGKAFQMKTHSVPAPMLGEFVEVVEPYLAALMRSVMYPRLNVLSRKRTDLSIWKHFSHPLTFQACYGSKTFRALRVWSRSWLHLFTVLRNFQKIATMMKVKCPLEILFPSNAFSQIEGTTKNIPTFTFTGFTSNEFSSDTLCSALNAALSYILTFYWQISSAIGYSKCLFCVQHLAINARHPKVQDDLSCPSAG